MTSGRAPRDERGSARNTAAAPRSASGVGRSIECAGVAKRHRHSRRAGVLVLPPGYSSGSVRHGRAPRPGAGVIVPVSQIGTVPRRSRCRHSHAGIGIPLWPSPLPLPHRTLAGYMPPWAESFPCVGGGAVMPQPGVSFRRPSGGCGRGCSVLTTVLFGESRHECRSCPGAGDEGSARSSMTAL